MKNYDEIINKMGEEIASLKEEVKILKNPMIYNFVDENMPGWAKEAVQCAQIRYQYRVPEMV